jgi:hypothetical protein
MFGAARWSPESTTRGKFPNELTAAACAALTGSAATCCPRLMKFFGCDHNSRTIGRIGAGNLRSSPAIRCTAEAVPAPNALAAAHASLGEPRAIRVRQNRTNPNRASHVGVVLLLESPKIFCSLKYLDDGSLPQWRVVCRAIAIGTVERSIGRAKERDDWNCR